MSPPLYAAKGMCSTRAGRTTALHPMRFELESQSHDLAPWCIRSRPCCVGARYALVEPQVNRDVRPISSDLRFARLSFTRFGGQVDYAASCSHRADLSNRAG